jgi:hypothetical protein
MIELLEGKSVGSNPREVTKTWITGAHSATMVIPKAVAIEHGLTEPSHIVVESVKAGQVIQGKGILIRRLDIPEILDANDRREKIERKVRH